MKLVRTSYTDKGTFGVLHTDDGVPFCVTCEEVWKDNAPKISCIPTGVYDCVPYSSTKFPNVWEVTGVKGRSKILIHSGNTVNDIEGCILVGGSFGMLANLPAVIGSAVTLNKLRGLYLNKGFKLTIC